jgi:PAS domain S-box-containing protein
MVSPDDLDRMLKQHRLRRQNPVEAESCYEFRFKTRYDELLDTLLFVTLIPGTGKSIASLFDITERKKAQRDLQVSENKYRTIFENVQDVFYQTDLDGIITEISPSIEKYSSFSREELIGMQVKSVYVDSAERDRFVELILQNGKVSDYELQLTTKDNRTVIVSSNSHIMYSSDGRPAGIEGSLRDVSGRKLAEKSLREAEQKYRTLVENLIEIVYRLDENAFISYISPNVEDIIGYSPAEIVGKKLKDFINQEDLSDNLELFKKVMSGSSSTFEYRISGKNGSEHWFRTSPRPVVEKGKTTGIQGVLTEVTVLKKAEEEKKNIEKDILRIQKMELIGTLAGGIAHNFNNILMGIMGYTSLMISERESDDPDYEYLKNISDSVSAATELTKNLLGFARGGKYEVKPVDINDLIKREIRIFSQTRKEVIIESFLRDGIPSVNADPGQLRQVFLNLFINACQAMPDGGKIYVRTENTTISGHDFDDFNVRAGEYIKVSVSDTGTGMDKTVLENIFTPFFSTREQGEGTGLGLASVYGILTNHGGSIKAYSEPGLGSTFVFILPVAETAVMETVETEKPEKLIRGNGVILLVDDEAMILNVGEKLLKYLGYDVLKAKSGKEAIEIYSGSFQDITMVILDMIMPDMDGKETYERLHSINPGVIVLLASGYSVDDYAQKLLKQGFCGFIQKPYNLNDLSGTNTRNPQFESYKN